MNNSPSGEPLRWENSVHGTILGPRRDGIIIDARSELTNVVLPNLQAWVEANPESVLDDCDVGALQLVIEEVPVGSKMRWEHCTKLFDLAVIGPDITLPEQFGTVSFVQAARRFITEHLEGSG